MERYEPENNKAPFNEQENTISQPNASEYYYNEQPVMQKTKQGTSFLKLLLAAILGSLLTLAGTHIPDLFNKNSTQLGSTPVQVDQKTTGNNIQLADMLEQVSPAVVGVINMQQADNSIFDILRGGSSSSEETPAGTGSGVIYQVTDNEAYIVTNNHVVEEAKDLKVKLSTGESVDATLIGTDALTDIAVLKISGQFNIKPITFADSSKIRTGDTVYAIGNPLGLELSGSVTEGIVSAKERTMDVKTSAGTSSVKVIQTDAAINPGNSGGALINNQGQLIGINTLKISADTVEGIGFAIPSNDTKVIIDQLVKNGKVVRPFMGLALISVDAVPSSYLEELNVKTDNGALVASTDETAGKVFKEGDVITQIEDQDVKTDGDVRNYIYQHNKAGDTVKFKIMRDGKEKDVSLKLRSTDDKKKNE